MKIGFVFCHGWGFNKDFWRNLKPYFQIYPCYYMDLGYFNNPIEIRQENLTSLKWIGIGHSLGFIKLLESNVQFSALIGLQAFTNFLGSGPELVKIRTQELNKIINNFNLQPLATLENFYNDCGLEFRKEQFKFINYERLITDLEKLKLNYNHLIYSIPLLVIGSKDDKIVPESLIKANFIKNKNTELIIHNKGRHLLGLNEADLIYENIMHFISKLNE